MKNLFAFCRFLTLLCVVCLWNFSAQAQDYQEEDKTLSPYFVVLSDNPETDNLPLKETSVRGNIVGTIADVTVRQVYVNQGKNPIEAVYTFPLSTRAAVYGMRMTIGQRVLVAKIDEKRKARKDYEQAKREGKRASLLEQSRPNVFTMNVSNIMVGDTIVVELKYTELLVPEKGVYTFVYPTVVGPRYSNQDEDKAPQEDRFVASGYTHEGVAPTYKFGYEMTVRSAVPIQEVGCTSHKMKITYPELRTAVLKLDKSEIDGGNRDVIVNYSLQGKSVESGIMLYEGCDENFFMLMAQPPKKVAKNDIPPREYVFIVDVSGSMWGYPMEITKKLMRDLIVNLQPTDKFNVVLFSSNLAVFSPISVEATSDNVQRAIDFIAAGNDWSGTEVVDALRIAYALPKAGEDVSRTFVIVTDGYVSVEKECFEMIRSHGGEANFFAFGIGRSVNRYLIEGMAYAGNGEPIIVDDENGSHTAAERFREYISTPVLTKIKFDAGRMNAYDVEPMSVPDMMAERPIVIFGKYTGKPSGTVTLSGKVGRKPYRQTFDLSQVRPDTGNAAIRYLWARERIKYLDLIGKGRRNPEEDTIARKILALGLKYNLMTNYTSFVAIDSVVANAGEKATTVNQPLPMPSGVSDHAVGTRGGNAMVSRKNMGVVNAADNAINNEVFVSVEVEEEDESVEEEIFVVVEDDPEFPGGLDSLKRFIEQNLVYPEVAKQHGIQGRVYVSFTVEKDGHISNVKVLRDIGGGCGAEAVRVVKMMPKWKPGKQRGVPVRCQFNMPIDFKL